MIKMEANIYIDGWKEKIRFSSAHVIPEYEKCGRLHGHTYAIHVKIYGVPDENGIIMDFSLLKEILKDIIKNLDHKILIPIKSKFVKIINNEKRVNMNALGKNYIFPIEDCILLPISSTSAERLSRYILDILIEKLNKYRNIEKIELGVDEGFGQGARVIKNIKDYNK
jgi:6-pyruvoyltetrahydropterin/6-carboxytetrahydropterin synthase